LRNLQQKRIERGDRKSLRSSLHSAQLAMSPSTTTSRPLMALILVLSCTMILNTCLAFQTATTGSLSSRSSRRPPMLVFNSQADKPSTTSPEQEPDESKQNPGLLRLAELSLKDYDWRSSMFKSEEADRKVEESLARMMGDEPAYVRPMDATEEKIGPLVSGGGGSVCDKIYTTCASFYLSTHDACFRSSNGRGFSKSHR
jgi:hypothetical protein